MLKRLLLSLLTIACISAAATAASPDSKSIAVLPVVGPEEIDSDSTLGFKIRTGTHRPRRYELAELPNAIEAGIRDKLAAKLGQNQVASKDAIANIKETTLLNLRRKKDWLDLGRVTNSRYLVSCKVSEIEFDGKLVTGDTYKIRINCRLIDSTTGTVVWHMPDKGFEKFIWTKSGQEPLDTFFDELVPKIVDYIVDHILSEISSPGAA